MPAGSPFLILKLLIPPAQWGVLLHIVVRQGREVGTCHSHGANDKQADEIFSGGAQIHDVRAAARVLQG
jgi:hypothetical protein